MCCHIRREAKTTIDMLTLLAHAFSDRAAEPAAASTAYALLQHLYAAGVLLHYFKDFLIGNTWRIHPELNAGQVGAAGDLLLAAGLLMQAAQPHREQPGFASLLGLLAAERLSIVAWLVSALRLQHFELLEEAFGEQWMARPAALLWLRHVVEGLDSNPGSGAPRGWLPAPAPIASSSR